ncbi:MAG: leucine-rich repeat protein, partial [Solobacterium sp.]|nr:leucine-rich repeat protein [Solobacterium sp.]
MKQIFQLIISTAMIFSLTTTVLAEEPTAEEPGEETISEVLPEEEETPEITEQEEETEDEEVSPAEEEPGEEILAEEDSEENPESEEPASEEETETVTEENPEETVADTEQEEVSETEETPEEEPAVEESAEEEAILLAAGTVFTPESDSLTYVVLDETEKTVAVTGGDSDLTSITIPAVVTYEGETYKVTEVAANAFENYKTITELKFAEDSNLIAIRANAFAYSKKSGIPATITNLVFPASLELVEDGAFHCIPVKHFALEDGSNLEEIPCGFLAADGKDGYPGEETESGSFFDFLHHLFFPSESYTPSELAKACDVLESVDFGDGNNLKLISMGAFKNQTHLTSIDFGEDSRASELIIANG